MVSCDYCAHLITYPLVMAHLSGMDVASLCYIYICVCVCVLGGLFDSVEKRGQDALLDLPSTRLVLGLRLEMRPDRCGCYHCTW